jgi:DNA-binding MarR family transcriptional regulator
MSQEYALSPSEEEYLESIYTKQEGRAAVATTRDLAECLGVKDASVTEMLKISRGNSYRGWTGDHDESEAEAPFA